MGKFIWYSKPKWFLNYLKVSFITYRAQKPVVVVKTTNDLEKNTGKSFNVATVELKGTCCATLYKEKGLEGDSQKIENIDAPVMPDFPPKSIDFGDCGLRRQPKKICIFGEGNYKVESFNDRLWAYKTIQDLLDKDECKDDNGSIQTNDNACKSEVSNNGQIPTYLHN